MTYIEAVVERSYHVLMRAWELALSDDEPLPMTREREAEVLCQMAGGMLAVRHAEYTNEAVQILIAVCLRHIGEALGTHHWHALDILRDPVAPGLLN